MRLPRLATLTLEEVLPYLEERDFAGTTFKYIDKKQVMLKFPKIRIELGGFQVCVNSLRLVTFKSKGTSCVSCGFKGTFFAVEALNGGQHLNLYGWDEDGDELMLTHDHIIPVSKGGKNILSNVQTMCWPCNKHKGSSVSIGQ